MQPHLPPNLLRSYDKQWALSKIIYINGLVDEVSISPYKMASYSELFKSYFRESVVNKTQNGVHVLVEEKEFPYLAAVIHYCHFGNLEIITSESLARTYPDGSKCILKSPRVCIASDLVHLTLGAGLMISTTYNLPTLKNTAYKYICQNLNFSTCWDIWSSVVFISISNKTVKFLDLDCFKKIESFLLYNFSLVVKLDGYLSISMQEVMWLLSSDTLNAHSESEVMAAIRLWIDGQVFSNKSEEDLALTSLIFKCIRLENLSPKCLEDLLNLPDIVFHKTMKLYRINNSHKLYVDRHKEIINARRLFMRLNRNLRPIASPYIKAGKTSKRYQNNGKLARCLDSGNSFLSCTQKLPIKSLSGGKSNPRLPHEVAVVFGGWKNGSPCKNVSILNPRKNKWFEIGASNHLTLPEGIMSFGIAIVKNRYIYIAGGEKIGPKVTPEVITLDLHKQDKTWDLCSLMQENRRDLAMVNFEDKILFVIGGDNNKNVLDSMEMLDLAKPFAWIQVAHMFTPRGAPAANVLNKKIYVCGGYTETRMEGLTNSAEVYDIFMNQWTIIRPMSQVRYYAQAIAYDKYIFVLGGGGDTTQTIRDFTRGQGYISTVERYSPSLDVWELMPGMSERADFGACLIEDKILCLGGGGEAFCTSSVESWRPYCGSNSSRFYCEDDEVILSNEEDENQEQGENVECSVENESKCWKKITNLPAPLWGHRCVCLKGINIVVNYLDEDDKFLFQSAVQKVEIYKKQQTFTKLLNNQLAIVFSE